MANSPPPPGPCYAFFRATGRPLAAPATLWTRPLRTLLDRSVFVALRRATARSFSRTGGSPIPPGLALVLALLIAVGCVPIAEENLAPPGTPAVDERLAGHWKLKVDDGAKDQQTRVFVEPVADDGMVAVVIERASREQGLSVAHYRLWATIIGMHGWLSIKPIVGVESGTVEKPTGASREGFILGRYRVADDGESFRVMILRDKFIKAAAKSGRLQTRKVGDDLVITSSRDVVRRVLVDLPSKAFDKALTFRKIDE